MKLLEQNLSLDQKLNIFNVFKQHYIFNTLNYDLFVPK